MLPRTALALVVVLAQAAPAPELPGTLAALDRDVAAGRYVHVDHIVIIRDGRTVFDRPYARDYRAISRGRVSDIGCGEGCAEPAWNHEFNYLHPAWHPFYQGRDVHTLQSVTKSIAATVVGIALAGTPGALDRPFMEFLPGRAPANADPRLARATLRDLLTMRSGIEWHESDRPLDGTNTTVQLEKSPDWIAFTLSQPMDAEPGTRWVYNSGGSALMAGIVREVTGRHIDEYAREVLFLPLGISDFHWKKSPAGVPDTEGGLYLRARDLARIGELYLADGVWNGRRILPEGCVRDATSRHVTGVGPGWDYGYQWWLTSRGGRDVWAGRGFGGQLLIVVPSTKTVAVVTAWNVFGGRFAGNIFDAVVDAAISER